MEKKTKFQEMTAEDKVRMCKQDNKRRLIAELKNNPAYVVCANPDAYKEYISANCKVTISEVEETSKQLYEESMIKSSAKKRKQNHLAPEESILDY